MQLKITTDYAIRCVLYLAQMHGKATSKEIGDVMGIPPNYVQQILRKLRIENLVSSSTGEGGGYSLLKQPKDISMMDIISPFEKSIHINRCLEDDGYCSRDGPNKHCPVHTYYSALQTMIEEYLTGTSVKDILDKKM